MILPDLILSSRKNEHWKFSGIDNINWCRDPAHFKNYPHNVEYIYNSRGFRDQEWPESTAELQSAIWCIGDSFTVGLGSPLEHTWPWQLAKISNQRIINVSMDGASNQWISRTAKKIIDSVGPKQMAIMWSYTHRRENSNDLLSDENRRIQTNGSSINDDWENFLECKKNIETEIANLVQFTIPHFHNLDIDLTWQAIRGKAWPPRAPETIEEFDNLSPWIKSEIKNLHNCSDEIYDTLKIKEQKINFISVARQDVARDGHHFDLITAEWVAEQAAQHLHLQTNSKT